VNGDRPRHRDGRSISRSRAGTLAGPNSNVECVAVPATSEPDDDNLGELTTGGIELAGALVGGGVGLVGGPGGALGGAAAGVVATRALKAAVSTGLAWRARDRAAAAVVLIANEHAAREDQGERPRDDGFFDDRGHLRPEAEDLLEGVLREAALSHDERKVALLARFYTAVEFDRSITAPEAHLLLRQLAQLTYRQFVGLSVIEQHERYSSDLLRAERGHALASGPDLRAQDPGISLELVDLASRRFVGLPGKGRRPVPFGATIEGLEKTPDSAYGRLRLLPLGDRIAAACALRDMISEDARATWLEELRGPPR
jgi:hypothetical protein